MDEDEELAIEFLLGTSGPKGRTYFDPDSERGKRARTILARKLWEEAPGGWFTPYVAASIDPHPHRWIERKIVFKRPRGTPVVVDVRRRTEIAKFMHEQFEKQKRGAASAAQARNLKRVIAAAMKEFGVGRSTVMSVWGEFRPPKESKNGSRSPTK